MGALLSRTAATAPTAATAAARTIPASAHKADAVAKAAIAAFPPIPKVSKPGAPMPTDEMEANRQMVDLLSKTSVESRAQPTGGASSSGAIDSENDAPEGVPLDHFVEALRLHGEDAQQWTAPTLAQKYGIVDVDALSDALAHVRTYRVVEDDRGRPRGVAIGEELPADCERESRVEDLFAKYDGAAPAPPPAGAA